MRRPPTCSPTGSGRSPRPGRASAPACTCAATSRWCRSARATAAPTTPRATPPAPAAAPAILQAVGDVRVGQPALSVRGQPESIQVAHQEADGEERAGQHAKDEADAPWAEALDGDRPGRPGTRARGWAGRRAASGPARGPPAGRTGARVEPLLVLQPPVQQGPAELVPAVGPQVAAGVQLGEQPGLGVALDTRWSTGRRAPPALTTATAQPTTPPHRRWCAAGPVGGGVQTKALRPVMARPTIRVLISRVPS